MTQPNLREALARGDLELGSLSDDEHRALFFAENAELTPEARPALQAAVRSLAAHGLANVDSDGSVTLLGLAALVRSASLTAVAAVEVHGTVDGTALHLTTVSLGDDIVLLERRTFPGIRHYRLERSRAARRAVIKTLLPGRSAAMDKAKAFSVPSAEPGHKKVAALRAAATARLTLHATRRDPNVSGLAFACGLIRSADGVLWALTPDVDDASQTSCQPVGPDELETLLEPFIVKEALASAPA
jgi:hypothetical protein